MLGPSCRSGSRLGIFAGVASAQDDSPEAAQATLDVSRAAALKSRSVRMALPQYGLVGVYTSDHRARVTITLGKARADMIRIGSIVYRRSNAAFLRGAGIPASRAKVLAGSWLRARVTSEQLDFLDKQQLVSALLTPTPSVRISGHGQLGTTPVVFLRDADENATVTIAEAGAPYPLRVSGDDGTTIGLSNWGAKVKIIAPKVR